jgi:hypothetical protein
LGASFSKKPQEQSIHIKSDEVGTTLKHLETINGNAKNLSKRIRRKYKGNVNFYFKNSTLPLGSI